MKINMKRVWITFSRYQKELEKLNNQLERAKEAYDKKYANAAKYGVQDWDSIEYCEWLETAEKTESAALINKEDVKKNGAWWGLFYAEGKVKDITAKIEIAEKKLKEAEHEFKEDTKMNKMIEFIENEINENNKYCNAIACDGDFAGEIIVHLTKKDGKERKRYNQVVRKALDLGALIKSTCPATLSVTLKF